MNLQREINRLLLGLLTVFGLIALSAAYWAIAGPDTILLREDNPRLILAEARIRRGDILDRNGQVLATSILGSDGQVTRRYPQPVASSITGYSSLRYGVGGTEAAYDAILRGDTLPQAFGSRLINSMLHRPATGSHVKLSVDLAIQDAMVQAFDEQRGAAVILSVPDGAVLGLVSLPTFDPDTLNEDWDRLVADPNKPFFNRVLQGSYQPGGMLQTPLMAAALLDKVSLSTSMEDANQPITLDQIEVQCALILPFSDLDLRDAFAFACPRPFADLAQQLGEEKVRNVLQTFRFNQPAYLPDFDAAAQETTTAASISIDTANLVESALGQGDLTVTPLEMAVMAAAIINDGNAPRPFILLATQAPDSADWTLLRNANQTIPFATQNTARELQDLMRYAVANGATLNAARPGIDIGGHASLAFSGDESQAWFVGFATLAGGRGIAAAVVLENSADPGLAADIGGTILQTAHNTLQQP